MPSIAFTDMSYHDSSDDSLRRLTDDFGRHKLTDLLEADETEEEGVDYFKSVPLRKRYSSIGSTASSIDGLWELHPRRLSEAGLSRHSDSSAILTEDTDSFIIGQRVWVGGTKPGTIAYIGETQFAPGDWAGIALDEPIGKNDGSVGGIRYFQCENKKGVFSRLTRLTRVPLEQPGMGSNETFISPNGGTRRSPISPTGSTRSLLKSPPSLSNSNVSLNSTATHHVDFKIGDRVIIKSTQGSKVGTVKYMGLTDFAPGEWVGVELDDPRGKNDGSVEGKRYFECRPHFGLFAPISKVSKSPSKYKPGACAVHSGLPPSGLKRANSKESMASMTSKTSVASSVRRVRLGVTSLTPQSQKVTAKASTPLPTRTALQDVLREKQQHIEQLLKERDLERAEITRAASQADEAEQKFFTLKQEFEKYRAECESKIQENSDLLSQLKVDRSDLLSQLEDEKRRNEDLQFRFEEASITKSDVEVTNENYLKKINELETNLSEELKKNETLESTSNKLFEAEESLIKAREEIDNLKSELDKTRKKREESDEERVTLLDGLQKQLDLEKSEKEDKITALTKLLDDYSKAKEDHEVTKRQVDEIKTKSDENCQQKDKEIEMLKQQLDNQKKVIDKLDQINKELIKENDKLKMDLSGKTVDVETANDQLVAKENEIKSLRNELETVKKEQSNKLNDLERHKGNLQEVEATLRKELEETRDNLKSKISEVENVKRDLNVQLNQKDQNIDEATKTISKNVEEITKLNNDLAEARTNFEENKNEIHSRHARQIASQDAQLMALSAEIHQKNEEITKSSVVISKLEEDLCTKNGIIEKLRLELESAQQQYSSHSESSSMLNQQISQLSLSKGDIERQLNIANERIAALIQTKERLEVEIQTLSAKCENAEQLEQLRTEIKTRETMLERVQMEYEQKLQNSERIKHEIELQKTQVEAKYAQEKQELESKLRVSLQAEEMLRQRCDVSIAEIGKIRDEHRFKINELEHLLQDKEMFLQNLESKCTESERYYQEQLSQASAELNRNVESYQQKIEALNKDVGVLKQELSIKSQQLIESNAQASYNVAQNQQVENELKQKYGEDIRRLEFELNEYKVNLEKTEMELQLLRGNCDNSNIDLAAKDRQISELSAESQRAQQLIVQLQEQLTSIQLTHQQKFQEHELVENRCKNLLEQVATLTEKVQTSETLFKSLQIEHASAMGLVNRLRITEQQKQACLQELQAVAVSTNGRNCDHMVEVLNQMKVENTTESTEKILELQKDVEIVKNQLAERNHELDVQRTELLRLQQELLKAQETNAKCVHVEGGEISLIQDKEMAENQIKFLNSIIVDIQRKNEEQKARIEILESGHSPAVPGQLNLMGKLERQVPPRAYCDICEEFDLHETEDCPQQNTDAVPSNGQRGPREERPYCEICEAFGHATEDCHEDETF